MRLLGVMKSTSMLSSRLGVAGSSGRWIIEEFTAQMRAVSKIAFNRRSNLASFLEANGILTVHDRTCLCLCTSILCLFKCLCTASVEDNLKLWIYLIEHLNGHMLVIVDFDLICCAVGMVPTKVYICG